MDIFNPRTYRTGFFSRLLNWQWTKDRFFNRYVGASLFGTNDPTIEVDCDDSMQAYMDCPHLRAVIDKKAEMFASGEWKCVSIKDESVEFPNDPGLALLNDPNPLQSREDFLFKASFYKSLFANNFIYGNSGSALKHPETLWHLPSENMSIKYKDLRSFFDQTKIEDIIDKYILEAESGQPKSYDVKDVIYKAENFSYTEGRGISKIPTLKLPINNLVASMKTRNVLTVNFGVKGFISSEGKDALGTITIKDDERKLIEKEFANDSDLYANKPKIKIVNVPTKFVPMSADLKDMLLLESEEIDFQTICAELGMKRDLFPFTKGATFENQKQAEVTTYQSTIMQDADSFAGIMTARLKPGQDRKYILSYDWLPMLKEDEGKAATAKKVEIEGLSVAYRDGIISAEDYAAAMNVEFSGDGELKNTARQITVD